MEEDTQHFWCIMFYYFKKGKKTTEMQKKKIVQGMEKVLWLIECVKVVCEVFGTVDILAK